MNYEKVITKESNERYELTDLDNNIVVVYCDVDVYKFGCVSCAIALLK